jgi:hypothetical protein
MDKSVSVCYAGLKRNCTNDTGNGQTSLPTVATSKQNHGIALNNTANPKKGDGDHLSWLQNYAKQ